MGHNTPWNTSNWRERKAHQETLKQAGPDKRPESLSKTPGIRSAPTENARAQTVNESDETQYC